MLIQHLNEIRNVGGTQSGGHWVPMTARIGFCFSVH